MAHHSGDNFFLQKGLRTPLSCDSMQSLQPSLGAQMRTPDDMKNYTAEDDDAFQIIEPMDAFKLLLVVACLALIFAPVM